MTGTGERFGRIVYQELLATLQVEGNMKPDEAKFAASMMARTAEDLVSQHLAGTSKCETCKFWLRSTLKNVDDEGQCHAINEVAGRSEKAWTDGGMLRTAATFGCVLHEPKEQAS